MGGQMPHPDPQSGHNPFCLPTLFHHHHNHHHDQRHQYQRHHHDRRILIEDVCATGRCSLHPGSEPVKEFAFNERTIEIQLGLMMMMIIIIIIIMNRMIIIIIITMRMITIKTINVLKRSNSVS